VLEPMAVSDDNLSLVPVTLHNFSTISLHSDPKSITRDTRRNIKN